MSNPRSPANSDFIKFLGTAGARIVVAKQLRSSAGTYMSISGTRVILDPGPGTLVRCASSKPRIEGADIDGIILTHRHIDHSTDVNVMIECMTEGGFKKRGVLFAPEQCLSGDDPVVLRYVRAFLDDIVVLKAHAEYSLGSLTFHTRGLHKHPVETYGLSFESHMGKISFIIDTEFFPELIEWYSGSAVLVMNVVRLKPHGSGDVMHLCLDDARKLITSIKPSRAIITHLGMSMLRAKPWELAEELKEETGVDVIAATDGKMIELNGS